MVEAPALFLYNRHFNSIQPLPSPTLPLFHKLPLHISSYPYYLSLLTHTPLLLTQPIATYPTTLNPSVSSAHTHTPPPYPLAIQPTTHPPSLPLTQLAKSTPAMSLLLAVSLRGKLGCLRRPSPLGNTASSLWCPCRRLGSRHSNFCCG